MRISLSLMTLFLGAFALLVAVGDVSAQESVAPSEEMNSAECWDGVIAGASLAAQPGPVFCTLTTQARDTAQILPERWIDTFDHGLKFADFNHTNYLTFDAVDGVYDSVHWRHADHWMVDIASSSPDNWALATGGSMMRPDRQFWKTDGKIVVEADFAAGHQDYRSLNGWGEFVITTGAAPSTYRTGGFYAYDMFPGHYTLGCRLQADRHVICALMGDGELGSAGGGRIWEASFFQPQGIDNYGGYPTGEADAYWRICSAENDPDSLCRDRFRMELTEDSLTLYVNGYRYFAQEGLPPLPAELFHDSFYVYFASMVGQTHERVMRFHWDRLAINPPTGPSAAANFVAPLPPEPEPIVTSDSGQPNERTLCQDTLCLR